MKKEKKYIVELTEKQLRLIADCVEDCHRFAAGQSVLYNTTRHLDNGIEIRACLRNTKLLITPHMPYNASYGWSGGTCPNDDQRKFIAQTYPIYREILHFFAVEGNHDNVYSSPTLTCEEGGEPIKIIRYLPKVGE